MPGDRRSRTSPEGMATAELRIQPQNSRGRNTARDVVTAAARLLLILLVSPALLLLLVSYLAAILAYQALRLVGLVDREA